MIRNIESRVWRDETHRSRWWAQRFELGRCVWLQYGFTSARKAMEAGAPPKDATREED